MSEWRGNLLEDLAAINAEIRRVEDYKKEAAKEYGDQLKGLIKQRDTILDKLETGERGLFDDEPTDPDIPPRIELDEDDADLNDARAISAEFDGEAPEPGSYLGDPPEPPPGDPEPPDDIDPETFFG